MIVEEAVWDVMKIGGRKLWRWLFGQKLELAATNGAVGVSRRIVEGTKFDYYSVAITTSRRRPVKQMVAYCTSIDQDGSTAEDAPRSKLRLPWENAGDAQTVDMIRDDEHRVDVFRVPVNNQYLEVCCADTGVLRRFSDSGFYRFDVVVTSALESTLKFYVTADWTDRNGRPIAAVHSPS